MPSTRIRARSLYTTGRHDPRVVSIKSSSCVGSALLEKLQEDCFMSHRMLGHPSVGHQQHNPAQRQWAKCRPRCLANRCLCRKPAAAHQHRQHHFLTVAHWTVAMPARVLFLNFAARGPRSHNRILVIQYLQDVGKKTSVRRHRGQGHWRKGAFFGGTESGLATECGSPL